VKIRRREKRDRAHLRAEDEANRNRREAAYRQRIQNTGCVEAQRRLES